ncbi:MAG: fibronectin type III domain-containing protein [Acutalibacteraceae bacterium]
MGTFENCPLTTIRLGKNVKTIEANAFNGIKTIPEIYYAGSEADWKNISIDQSNDMILRANMHYNVDITHTHSYTSVLTKKATCTENGVKTFTCDCGKTYTETIPATGHKYATETHAATCTSIGVSIKKCTVCGTVASASTTPAKGHNFVSEITAATCTSIGYETKTCKNCGECHFVRVIPNKGHTLETDITPATFTESGLSITSCKTCGTITKATLIKRIASVTLSATKYTYNGKAQTPTVTVKDSAGNVLKKNTDYTVSYASGRKNPGKYTVKVTFKGNYTGEKTLTFTIAPTAPTLTVTAGAKKATLKWNKQTGATGYVVYMATSKNGKYTKIAAVKGNTAVSYTKTGLTTGKTYYFKVAAYTTSGGSNIYSAFSAVKGVKVK